MKHSSDLRYHFGHTRSPTKRFCMSFRFRIFSVALVTWHSSLELRSKPNQLDRCCDPRGKSKQTFKKSTLLSLATHQSHRHSSYGSNICQFKLSSPLWLIY